MNLMKHFAGLAFGILGASAVYALWMGALFVVAFSIDFVVESGFLSLSYTSAFVLFILATYAICWICTTIYDKLTYK